MPNIGGIDLTAGTIAAFGALLVYDFFLTFGQEVRLVWPSRWTLGKILFYLNRYLPFFDTFLSLHLLTGKNTDRGCLLGFSALTWLIVVGMIISEIILMLRTYAIWIQSRVILIVLVLLGVGIFIPVLVTAQFEVESLAYEALPNGRCKKAKPSSPIILVAFIALIFSETTIVVLTLIRAFASHRHSGIRSPLVKQLYKDGLFYYIYLIAFSILNVIITVAAPPEYANWLTTPMRVIHSLLCTRVLLHIRSRSSSPNTELTSAEVSETFAGLDVRNHSGNSPSRWQAPSRSGSSAASVTDSEPDASA